MKEQIAGLIESSNLTPLEKLLLILLELNGGALRISNKDLAKTLTCYSTTAQKIVKNLKRKGLLKSEVLRYGLKGQCQRTLISLFTQT